MSSFVALSCLKKKKVIIISMYSKVREKKIQETKAAYCKVTTCIN